MFVANKPCIESSMLVEEKGMVILRLIIILKIKGDTNLLGKHLSIVYGVSSIV